MSTETNHTEFDRELLSAYVDGELTVAERAQVEELLADDPTAAQQVEEFRRLSGMIQDLPRPTLPTDFSSRVLEHASRTSPETKPEPLRPGISLGRSWRGWLWASAALAAALLIMVAVPQPHEQREMARRDAPGEKKQAERFAALPDSPSEDDRAISTDSAVVTDGNALRSDELADQPQITSNRMSVADSYSADRAALGAAAPTPRLLIVRVSMPPDALAKRELDRLFRRNDIDVELANDGDKLGEEKAVDRSQELVASERNDLRTFSYGQLNSIEAKDSDAHEVVLVEAPEEQILACLETMQKDSANFHSVEIEEDSPILKRELSQNQIAQDKWQKFNRGSVANQERQTRSPLPDENDPPESDPPENAPPEKFEPEDASPPPPQPAPPLPAPMPDTLPAVAEEAGAQRPEPESLEEGMAEANMTADPKSLAPRGKAYRYWKVDEPQKRALTDLTRRRQVQKEALGGRTGFGGEMSVDAAKQPLQVLFVIQDAPPQPPAPSADEKPLPAAETAPK